MPAPSAKMTSRRVKRSFVGEGEAVPWRKGTVISLQESKAEEYDAKGLTEKPPARPTAEAAAASAAGDARQKAATASETKETTGKSAAGLEPWPLESVTPDAYIGRYGARDDNSDDVKERLKLARAYVKAGKGGG